MDFDPQRKGSFVSGSGRLCQISSKLVQNCDRESTDTHTHTDTHIHTYTHRDHTSDLIICPMLCYSNGTDNYYQWSDYTITAKAKQITRTSLGSSERRYTVYKNSVWRYVWPTLAPQLSYEVRRKLKIIPCVSIHATSEEAEFCRTLSVIILFLWKKTQIKYTNASE